MLQAFRNGRIFTEHGFESGRTLLVRDGRILRRNLKQEHLAEDELMGKLREHGVDDVKEVKAAFIEPEGEISVIKKKTRK